MEFLPIVSPVLSAALPIAISLVKSNYQLLQGLDNDIRRLMSRLTAIQFMVQDAEDKQLDEPQISDWLGKINEPACDAQDILKSLETEAYLWQRKYQGSNAFHGRLSKTKRSKNKIMWATEIKNVLARLDDIADERKFHLNVISSNVNRGRDDGRQTSFFVVETDVLGREEDRDTLIRWLLSKEIDREEDVAVLAIVGMGGLGKTSLAQLVYNNDQVKNSFEFNMWVCVTNKYDYRRVIKEMIEYRSEMKYDITTMSDSQLVTRLLELIAGQRFFLVLDDVWIESYNTWKNLKDLINKGAKGSRVMITTRSTNVSNVTCTEAPYLLNFLPEEKCQSLFERCAFKNNDNIEANIHEQMKIIGRQIVSNCKGLPLAIKALGGALHGETNLKKWQRIIKHKIWDAEDGSSSMPMILPALKLSYDLLPSHLKQCFSYCHIFPKSHVFDKNELVKLWKAQSFILPDSDREETLDEIGTTYFDTLTSKSFFQTIPSNQRYKMHDLHHDLAQYVSSPHCYQIKDPGSYHQISQSVRHASLVCHDVEEAALILASKANKLRTLILPNIQYQHFFALESLEKMLKAFKYLRTLDLSSSSLTELPSSVEELKLLHHIDLSRTEIRRLPDSICNLYNLLTLKLLECLWLVELPKDLGKLVNLENLELDSIFWFTVLVNVPPRLGHIHNLQNLHSIHISREIGYGIDELKEMKFLKGSLHISKLENAVNAAEAKLDTKENLDKLVLEWSHVRNTAGPVPQDDVVLNDLTPHTNLKELKIIFYTGTNFPDWLRNGLLRNLKKLFLNHCSKCKNINLGKLEYLTQLQIKGMLDLEEWLQEPSDLYPSLDTLKITNCPKLTRLPSFLPSTRVLGLKNCPSLVALPLTPNLQFLELVDNLSLENWKESSFTYEDGQGHRLTSFSFMSTIELKIINCPKLQTLPVLFFPQKLEIVRCQLIRTLPTPARSRRLQCLALDVDDNGEILTEIPETESLYSLSVSNSSGGVTCLPELPLLSGLLALHLHNCTSLACLFPNTEALPRLKTLSILNCGKLRTLTDQGLPETIECLSIDSCLILELLGPQNVLTSLSVLKDLYILNCPALGSFPEEGFPASLSHLQIGGCQLLSKKCQEDSGADWSKIRNIPDLQVEPFNDKSSPSSVPPPWFCCFACGKG